MNLKTMLLVAGAAATGVIALSAAVVFTGSGLSSSPSAVARTADAIAPDEPAPDPAASGIIIVTADRYHYWLDPEGEYGSLSQWRYPADGVSSNGRWLAGINWDDDVAFLAIFDRDNPDSLENTREIHFSASLVDAEWAPDAPLLAAWDEDGLYLVDPASGEAGLLAEGVTAYAWASGDRLIYATRDDAGAVLFEADAGVQPKQLAALGGAVERFYVSPQRDQVLYAQDDAEGWRLLSLDPASGAVSDYGNLGHAWMKDYGKPDRAFTATTKVTTVNAPELAVAWSPSGEQIAVGPVEAPYVMYLIEPYSKTLVRSYSFEEGYAGELSWSPDGTQLAISTYSPDRTRHEVYVMDVAAHGVPRHLLDGCKIVWSPDSRFVAVKREPHDATGVAAIRVDSGYHWALSQSSQFIPVSWGEDQQTAVALASEPLPYAVQLGK